MPAIRRFVNLSVLVLAAAAVTATGAIVTAGDASAVAGTHQGIVPPKNPAKNLPPAPDFLSSGSCANGGDGQACNAIVRRAITQGQAAAAHHHLTGRPVGPRRDSGLMYHVNAENLPGNEVSRTFEGGEHGSATVSFFLVHNHPGQGPKLHHHPYDETFIVLEGRVRVQIGDETVDGGPGDIVVGPPGVPHGFTNLGPGRARLVCIHAAPAMKTEFVE